MSDAQLCKVLVVEDTESHVLLAQATMERFGIVPLTARNYDEAIACFEKTPLDLILMDLQLPAKSGYEITYELRRLEYENNRPRTPIIAVTAFMVGDAESRCQKAGMDGCVSKPLSVALCAELFAKYLPHKKIERLPN